MAENIPTNTVLVIAGEEEPEICEKIKDMDEKEEIIKDTMKNSGLFLCLGSTYYPVGQTTMKSIETGQDCRFCAIGFAEGEISPGIK